MIFIGWRAWIVVAVPLLIAIAAIVGFRYAGRIPKRLAVIAVRVLCVPVFLLASLLFVLLLAGEGCTSYSAPIYSPSRKMAVRITTFDEGAVGGATSVTLYWAYGLRQASIAEGTWRAVEPSDIHWINDSQLEIRYRDTDALYQCNSTSNVKVGGLPRPQIIQH